MEISILKFFKFFLYMLKIFLKDFMSNNLKLSKVYYFILEEIDL